MEQKTKYSFILRNLHIIGGLVFVAALVLGIVMEDMARGPEKFQLMFFHKSLGLAVLGLVALRLLEWVRSAQPVALESHANWEVWAAKLVKIALYIVMIVLPISGVLMSWFKGYPAAFFGLFELAPMVEKSKDLGELFESIHKAMVPLTFVLLGLHVVGALKHHFIDRDETLVRISPFSKG
ncbi:cytochrome b [Terasakiella brassicae]|uniref:Cytochrome b n=1 Tax=Terasakiella brassicae TaxID=1634917 RepID=A0A917F9H6_9PROT|nr:cytochrome b [Terasakiella brassicae]GGF59743.1 cytochrome b [Terasakiella brassicae]